MLPDAPVAPTTGPESLETPYADPLPPPGGAELPARPEPPQALPAPSRDKRPVGPIRARRKLALLGEIGWNGLAGFGAILTYNAHPHIALDLAGGFSLLGWKGGVRARYNLLTANFTPFVGVGFNATSGLGEITSDPKDDPHADPGAVPFTLDLKASYLIQYTLGFDFIHRRGFTLVGAIGYAQLLNKGTVTVLDGDLTSDERAAINVFFKGGAVISLAMGYAFE